MKRTTQELIAERTSEMIGAMKYLTTIPEGDSLTAFRRIKQVFQSFIEDREKLLERD